MTEQKPVVEVKQNAGLEIPAKGRGFARDTDQGDYEIPRAKVVTFTSKETKDPDESKRIPAGRFINSITKEELPKVFVPILAFKNYVRWNPMKKEDAGFDSNFEPGKMIFSTRDRHDPRVVAGIEFGPNGEKPLVTKVFSYLCRFEGQVFPLILSFKSTSYKGARRFNMLLEAAGGDLFSNKYTLQINLESKNGNDFYVYSVQGAGKATPEEFAICEGLYNRFADKDIETMAHQDEVEVPAAETW